MRDKEIIENGDILVVDNRISQIAKSGNILNDGSIKEIDLILEIL